MGWSVYVLVCPPVFLQTANAFSAKLATKGNKANLEEVGKVACCTFAMS